ncbi:MAG: 4'-phosphopantetheinyl transferase superfamily protein [Chloroflexi bacterium]|nr:4'-phosphopantetheinyl transferase superfamily protein [Chloroflexota bacterium]
MRDRTGNVWWSSYRRIFDVDVFHVDLAINDNLEAVAFGSLNSEERARWRNFLFPGPKRRFALCRAALRHIICERLSCKNDQLTFGEAERGKPYALVLGRQVSISFNVTHSGRHGLLAVGRSGRIGIDVEERRSYRHIDLVSESVFGANELCELKSVHGEHKVEMFFNLWTVKEALVKALGAGMSLDTSEFEVPERMRLGAKRGVFVFPHLPEVRWQLEDLSDRRFAAALAYEIPSSAVA